MASIHMQALQKLCRLCGSAKAIPGDRPPKSKLDFHIWTLKALSIDFKYDIEGVHPEFICTCCILKLQRWKKKDNKKQKCALNISVATYQPHSNLCTLCPPDDRSTATKETELQNLILENCKDYRLVSWMNGDSCFLAQINTNGTAIMKRVCVGRDGRWTFHVKEKVIVRQDIVDLGFKILDLLSTEEDVHSLLKCTKDMDICFGNSDIFGSTEYSELRKGFPVEEFFFMDGTKGQTLRHSSCRFIAHVNKRCELCSQYRCNLFAKRSQMRALKKTDISLSSHQRNDLMSSGDKDKKFKLMKERCTNLTQENAILRQQVNSMFVKEALSIEKDEGEVLKEIFVGEENSFKTLLKQGSPQELLWQQQKENLQNPPSRWRWHPDIIKWCVALHSKSPAAYNLIRQSGFLTLPSLVTLNKHIHFTKAKVGINADIVKRVAEEINAQTGDINQNVTLILDEMKIKSGLAYSCSSGKIIGFCDTGEINNLLSDFGRRVQGEDDTKSTPLATHVLVVMVRTIFSNTKAPIAYFATGDLKGNDLYPIVWDCIRHLEFFGIHVRAIVADGASQNKKFFKLHEKHTTDALTYFTNNPYRSGERIYFFCDVPHLLKTTRNNWENSGYNSRSRNLRFKGKEIRWTHLLSLQEWDQQLNAPSPGLRFVHKLTYEHLNLTPSLRMRVYLAAQVLSKTVANALESMGKPELSSTILFIRTINDWFDCLNVANTKQHFQGRNANLAPYKSVDDERFKWLENNFLGFLDEWYAESQSAEDVPKKDRYKLFISRETYSGMHITVKSFVSLAKELLQNPSVEYVLSEKFSQDPLEEYFSKQRGCGGRNDNPSVQQVGHNMLSLMVAGSRAVSSLRSNCRKRPREDEDI